VSFLKQEANRTKYFGSSGRDELRSIYHSSRQRAPASRPSLVTSHGAKPPARNHAENLSQAPSDSDTDEDMSTMDHHDDRGSLLEGGDQDMGRSTTLSSTLQNAREETLAQSQKESLPSVPLAPPRGRLNELIQHSA